MKLGCHALQWGFAIDKKSRYTQDGKVREITFQEVLQDISGLGYSGFEAPDEELRIFASSKNEFRELVTESGLELASTWSTVFPKDLPPSYRALIRTDLPMSDPRQYEPASISKIEQSDLRTEVKRQLKFAQFASAMGLRMLTVRGPYMVQEDIRDNYYALSGQVLNELADGARELGMRIAYHPEVGTLVKTSAEVDRLFDYADKKSVHLCLETAHLTAMGENPVDYVNKYRERIIHVHMKDYKNGQFCELGRGSVDFASILEALRKVSYDGWLMAEVDVPSPNPLQSARENKTYLDRLVGKGQQGLA